MLLTWQEFSVGGRPQGGSIVEDLRDILTNVSPIDRPALALFRKTQVRTTYTEWQEDTLPARGANAYTEGAGFTDQALTTPTRLFAHVQTFARWGQVSDEQRAVAHAGFRDALLYQEQKAIDATLNDLEHALHRQTSVTGATNAARQFNGLLSIFTTNFTSSSGTTLTEDIFGDLMQSFQVNDADIRPSAVLVNNWLKRTISQYSTRVTRYVDAAARVQINTIERHQSDFGEVDVYYTRDQLRSTTRITSGNSIIILDPNFFEVGFLQPLQSEMLERDGLRTRFQISAMASLIYRTQRAGGGGTGYVSYLPTAT